MDDYRARRTLFETESTFTIETLYKAAARRLIEGGSDIVRWNSVRRSASAR